MTESALTLRKLLELPQHTEPVLSRAGYTPCHDFAVATQNLRTVQRFFRRDPKEAILELSGTRAHRRLDFANLSLRLAVGETVSQNLRQWLAVTH